MSIGIITVEFLVIGVYSQGVFCWKHCLYLNCCFAIWNSISVWYFTFRFLWDMIVDMKVWFEYTYKASENRALKAIYRLVQCNPLLKHRTICHHSSCSHKLGNETVHVYQVPSCKKKQAQFYERLTQTLKNVLLFPSRIKTIVSGKFSRIRNAISEPKIGHVTDRCACYHWWPDKPSIVWRYRIGMLLFIYTVCLHLG